MRCEVRNCVRCYDLIRQLICFSELCAFVHIECSLDLFLFFSFFLILSFQSIVCMILPTGLSRLAGG